MPQDHPLDHVPVALTPLERFDEYLRTRGMRNTKQRRILVEYVFSQHDHFDADALLSRLPRKGQARYVSRPTVYRTLAEFVDAGLIRKLELDGRVVYEHDYGYPQHDHLHCQRCQRLIEFQSAELLALRDRVAYQHQFRVAGHRLIITGLCASCWHAQRQRGRRKPGS